MVNFLSHCTLLYFLAAWQKKRPCSTGGGGIWWISATYWSLWFLILSMWRDSFDRFSPVAAAKRENSAKSMIFGGFSTNLVSNVANFLLQQFSKILGDICPELNFVRITEVNKKNRESILDFNGLSHHQERSTPSVIGDLLVWQVKPGKTSISPTLTSISPTWACFYFASIGH